MHSSAPYARELSALFNAIVGNHVWEISVTENTVHIFQVLLAIRECYVAETSISDANVF